MANTLGKFNLGSYYNVTVGSPLDVRTLVATVDDLTAPDSWNEKTHPAYKGMLVVVEETGEVFVLKSDHTGVHNFDNWKKIGGGGSSESDDHNWYEKPYTGIPKSDLSKTIQESLAKADSALQEHQDISHLATKTELETVNTSLKDVNTKQSAQISDNKTRIDATATETLVLIDQVETLTGDGEGSVVDITSQEVAKILTSAPDNLDKLQEIANFISADAVRAAEISNLLNNHTNRIEQLENKTDIMVINENQFEMIVDKEDKFYYIYEE